jgi:5-hydroxyisourate hydrolase
MSAITTHVLDTSRGRPASGIPVTLEQQAASGEWTLLGKGATDGNGRLQTLMHELIALTPGAYRLTFHTRAYFAALGLTPFFPVVTVVFDVEPGESHYHVPLLLSPFGYTTYRGS